MTSVFNMLRYVPKHIAISIAFAVALVSTFTVFATPDVMIEGKLEVANHTQSQNTWEDGSVNAGNGDTVKFRIYYHNTELSITDKIAENLSIKVDFPDQPGSTQTATATIKGDNTNTIVDSATVNLDSSDAYLELIPGSTVWKHNIGGENGINYQYDSLADSVILGGNFFRLEDQKPCFQWQAWVTFEAKVITPQIELEKQVASTDSNNWGESVNAVPGDEVSFLLTVNNTGDARVNVTKVEDTLPAGLTYVQGSSVLTDSSHPNGIVLNNGIINGGIPLGDIAAGGNAQIEFKAIVNDAEEFTCGINSIVNNAVAHTSSSSDNDTASVSVMRECQTADPVFDCDALQLTIISNQDRTIHALAQVSMSDDVTLEGVSINFGDGLKIDANDVEHTYDKYGKYTVIATVSFNVGEEVKTAECSSNVTFSETIQYCTVTGKTHLRAADPNCKQEPTTPVDNNGKELPNTGAGSILLSIVSASTAASAGYGLLKSRR